MDLASAGKRKAPTGLVVYTLPDGAVQTTAPSGKLAIYQRTHQPSDADRWYWRGRSENPQEFAKPSTRLFA
jgi:hypothetical protein